MDEMKAPAATETPPAAMTPHEELANGIATMLSYSGTTIDNPTLQSMADEVFKGSRGAGTYNPRDAYDAMEAGVNRYIEQSGIVDFADPAGTMARLRQLISRLPRQTDRTERQVEFQQFSTPPEEAFLVAYAAGIKPGMVVVEPSAGTGDIAVMARIAGARVIVNEIDPVRAGLLRAQGFETHMVDAELLDGMLPQDVKPDIIVMNPPFSATGGRVAGHDTAFGGRHVKQALLRVNKGGRVVSVVGTGMAHGKPKMDSWWQEIEGKFTVRANVGIDGASYGKYGTTFDNNILVIDKTGPTPGLTRVEKIESIIRGEGQSPADALSMLEPLAKENINERLEQSGRPGNTASVQGSTGTPPVAPGATSGRGNYSQRPGAGDVRPNGSATVN
jgi:predicted RNA methylase